jgi:hypothetical protein
MHNRKIHRGGWMMIDVMFGMTLIALMGVALSVGIHRQGRVLLKLENARAAARTAEAALLSLQSGNQSTAPGVTVRPLPDAAVPGFTWVQAESVADGKPTVLIGLSQVAPAENHP